MNPARTHPWPRSVSRGSFVAMSCVVGLRSGSDPKLPWLWCRLAATALIQPLTWELPYALGTALKIQKTKKKTKKPALLKDRCHKTKKSWETILFFFFFLSRLCSMQKLPGQD